MSAVKEEARQAYAKLKLPKSSVSAEEKISIDAKIAYCILEGKPRIQCIVEVAEELMQEERAGQTDYNQFFMQLVKSGARPEVLNEISGIQLDEARHEKILARIISKI